jgi:hypothetical protein
LIFNPVDDVGGESVMFQKMDPDELDQVRMLRRGLVGWLSLFYSGAREARNVFSVSAGNHKITDDGSAVHAPEIHFNFEEMLREAIQKAENREGKQVSEFDLSVETEPIPETPLGDVNTDELLARFERGESLEGLEIAHLRDEGKITDEELDAYYDTLASGASGVGFRSPGEFFGLPDEIADLADDEE